MGFMTSYDRNNVPLFNKGEQAIYLCSMCGQYTTLNESVSYRGFNLICNRCHWKIKSIMSDEMTSKVLSAIQNKGRQTYLDSVNTGEYKEEVIECIR